MLFEIFRFLLIVLVIYVAVSGLYQFLLAIAYFLKKDPVLHEASKVSKFAIFAPAHNEELLIGSFCESMEDINYDKANYAVYVIADNCTDGTEEICKNYNVEVLSRQDLTKKGKGYALEWATEKVDIDAYDAIIVLDADTTVDKEILNELNRLLNNGEKVIQCYINVPNKGETWFTQLISLSRTINDLLYHDAKYKLGLSAYLMGTGMCFDSKLLQEVKWNAYSLSEDWEYYAKLVGRGHRVAFSKKGVINQMESSNLKQATSQRLRWASGRFYVVKNLGFKLLITGLLKIKPVMADASLALLLPNWSLQINLILLSIAATLFLPNDNLKLTLLTVCGILILIQAFIVICGAILTGSPFSYIKAIALAPVFLIWKLIIDVLCLTKLYKGKDWVRTKRHIPKK